MSTTLLRNGRVIAPAKNSDQFAFLFASFRAFVPSCLRVRKFFAPLRLCVRFFCLAIFLSGCCPIIRTTIPKTSGHVYDAQTHRPIANATFAFRRTKDIGGHIIETDEVAVKTGKEGEFSFSRRREPDLMLITDTLFPLVKPYVVRHQGHRDYLGMVSLPYFGPWPSPPRPAENLQIFLQPEKR